MAFRPIVLGSVLFCLGVSPSGARSDDSGTDVLEEIVVRATRIETNQVSLPFAVGSVGRD